jgi:hypothetical protein
MDIEDYRGLQQRIRLTGNGQVPTRGLTRFEEKESALARIDRTWRLIERFPKNDAQEETLVIAKDNEIWTAFKRWFTSHHLFIPELALTGYCLNELIRARKNNEAEEAQRWMHLAARLRKGCAGLFLFSIDFRPCAEIYGEVIRPNMPKAFSGFWIRERHNCFQPALKAFSANCSTGDAEPLMQVLRTEWAAADKRYHELHEQSIYAAVPDGISLARDYHKLTGKPHEITEHEFQVYDDWFCIDRCDAVTRLDYIFQVCDVIERLLADLASGHHLECAVASDLLNGAKAAMTVFGQWAGPVSERSSFYPKCLGGE